MMQQVTVIKVGGAIVEDNDRLQQLLSDFSKIEGLKVLVHGGGRRATKVAAALGIESKMVEGRRVTDADMLEVVTMVYGGLVNKNLVARLQALGVNAIGLTGADMDVIRSHKRPPVMVTLSDTASDASSDAASNHKVQSSKFKVQSLVDYGFVGDVDKVNADTLKLLLENGIVPVMAPLTHDGKGNILNTNADTIAAETAKALAKYFDVTLMYCFEKAGVLSNPDDDNSVIPVITHADYDSLTADGTISGGMKPKIQNALAAVDAGVSRVIITKASAIDGKHGTVIKK